MLICSIILGYPHLFLEANTVFRQAFLLIQYSFICTKYFFCSDREYQYFFVTDGKQNS